MKKTKKIVFSSELIDYLKQHMDAIVPGSTLELTTSGSGNGDNPPPDKPKDPTLPPVGPGH